MNIRPAAGESAGVSPDPPQTPILDRAVVAPFGLLLQRRRRTRTDKMGLGYRCQQNRQPRPQPAPECYDCARGGNRRHRPARMQPSQ